MTRKQSAAPKWEPKEDIVFLRVDNPEYSCAHTETSGNRRKVKLAHNARESAIITMAARGHLNVAQIRAAKSFCYFYERLGGAGAGSFDYSRELVDGGGARTTISDSQIQAGQELKKCQELLGVVGYDLVSKIAGQGFTLDAICSDKRRKNYATDHLRDCLDVLAAYWGYTNTKITAWRA
ncbi:hypothetical protein F9L00_12710 [Brucella anthropi]|uniref:hypothetical protein n=1 Tax=Brucella/Ochrobactrum group TaxID=2826938 RepID=UPI00124ED16E|nr:MULTISPECIES: hypothetical protein [Brucella/Ochrobactrum group]KAB2761727.1 hypothetical protein F9K98_15525 [Brucella anthropi]KAB2777583.1 hypothetical protein F9L00_12710 [Brucella anthropi]MCQ9145125.1 hypothetical protein [Ochrobactrum sp. BTU2]UGQ23251.1 hypothetical protein LRL11_22425 [Brucella anthropi]